MSTNKTTNYDLHAWEPGDDFLRSEFNENFSALDTKLHTVEAALPSVKKLRIATGSYQGTGSSVTQTISLGFRPRMVLAMCRGTNYQYRALYVEGADASFGEITDQGFTVSGYLNYSPTSKDTYADGSVMNPYTYLAIGWEN